MRRNEPPQCGHADTLISNESLPLAGEQSPHLAPPTPFKIERAVLLPLGPDDELLEVLRGHKAQLTVSVGGTGRPVKRILFKPWGNKTMAIGANRSKPHPPGLDECADDRRRLFLTTLRSDLGTPSEPSPPRRRSSPLPERPRRPCHDHPSHVTGKVKVNAEPLPTSLSTQILPPCSSMNLRQSAKPRPVPSCFAALDPTWRNSSKTTP
jgi:hypothetical protein